MTPLRFVLGLLWLAEMRRTILGWAWNSGYVRYDREKGWRLNAPSKGSKGGRLIE